MAGFESSYESLIVNLKKLLDDQYDVASIPKELLQNAEDAGARSIHYAWIEETNDPKAHPLLRAAALIVVNDGHFKWDDSSKIKRLGLGAKGADTNAIGKFGLGMKSVFNLTETLFYYASADQDASREQARLYLEKEKISPEAAANWRFRECLNAWHGTAQHRDWQLYKSSVEARLHDKIMERLSALEPCSKDNPWFALYIPLRNEEIKTTGGCLSSLQPQISDIFGSDMSERLSFLVPMLRNIEHIQVWKRDDKARFALDFAIELAKSQRPGNRIPLIEQSEQIFPFSSQIKLRRGKDKGLLQQISCGREILLEKSQIWNEKLEADWPQTWVWNAEEASFVYEREKGEPHAATAWLRSSPRETGKLYVGMGVFLPLPQTQIIPFDANPSVRLLLHGYFFVDAGRNRLVLDPVSLWDEKEEKPESLWNRRLLEKGVLPQVLPSLAEFLVACVDKDAFSDHEIRELTRALSHADWLIENPRAALTRNGNWLYRLSGPPKADLTVSALKRKAQQKTAKVGAWKIEEGDEFWLLPAPPEGEAGALEHAGAKVFEWLPALEFQCRHRTLAWDWPRFTRAKEQDWSEDQILALLKNCKGETLFGSAIALRYFLDLLGSFGPLPDAIWERVLILAEQALRSFPFGMRLKEEQLVRAWRDFWAMVPRERWLPFEIGISDTSAEKQREFTAGLLALGLERTPVPSDLTPEIAPCEGDDGKWNATDARKVAQWFAFLLHTNAPLAEVVRVLSLLEKTGGGIETQFDAFGDLALFKTKEWREWHDDVAAQSRVVVTRSWQQLRELREAGRLWREFVRGVKGGGDWLRDWCRAVDVTDLDAEGEPTFLVSIEEDGVRQPLSGALWPKAEKIESFDAKACLQLLQNRPQLRDIAGRAALAPRLFDALKSQPKSENQRAVRYLLHGRPNRFIDAETPLFKEARGSEIWHRLALAAIPKDEKWTLIASDLSARISDEIAAIIEVKTLDKSGTLDVLRATQSELSDLRFDFSSAERHEILRDLTADPNDDALFRALPLHEILSETGFAIGALPQGTKCFLEGAQIRLPPELRQQRVLVAQPADSRLRETYKDFGIGEFEAQSVLELALSHVSPQKFAELILQTLSGLTMETILSDIREILREIPWMETPRGAFAPVQIVHLPRVSLQVETICQDRFIGAAELERHWGTHAGWSKAASLWPDLTESAQLLREELETRATHHAPFALGELSIGATIYTDLPKFLEGWQNSGAALPDGVALLKRLAQSDIEVAAIVAPALLAPVGAEVMATWGRAVSQAASKAPDASREHSNVALHFWLFEAWASSHGAGQEQLRGWFFPSQSEVWCAPEKLTRVAEGVQKSVLLHADWARVLERRPALCQSRGGDKTISRGDPWGELKKEMASWETTDALKGALIAVLGASHPEDKQNEELCADKFGGITDARLNMWKSLGGVSNSAASDLAKARNYPFKFRFVEGQGDEKFPDLLGEPKLFPLESHDFNSLIVGPIEEVSYGWEIRVRRMSDDKRCRSRALMNALISETLRALLQARDEFNSRPVELASDDQHHKTNSQFDAPVEYRLSGNLDVRARQWSETEQIDLSVAQEFMLDCAFFYFRTLGACNGQVADLMREHDEWRYAIQSKIPQRQIDSYGRIVEIPAREIKTQAFDKLRARLEGDDAFARETLKMVRDKIRDNGYDSTSVFFELFQNADDCTNERVEAGLGDGNAGQLDISLNRDGRVSWTHGGRKMNIKGAYGNISLQRAQRLGYGRDLEKMLILQASDKSGQGETTGKFGLGFKSVYLVCEKPRVESGELRFEVCGGFYPQKIDGEGNLDRDKTRISFEVEPSELTSIAALFWRVLPLQLTFSRRIETCNISIDNQNFSFRIERERLADDVEIVSLHGASDWPLGESVRESLPSRLLILGDAAKGVLALGLSENGIQSLPLDIPCLWATTPTRAPIAPGFAISAPWQVDVGRAQIAGGHENTDTARSLGTSWRAILSRLLVQSEEDWPKFRDRLGLNSHLTSDEFWRGLATLLSAPIVRTDGTLGEIFELSRGALSPLKKWIVTENQNLIAPKSIVSLPNLGEIADKWKGEKDDYFSTKEGPFFPSGMQIYDTLGAENSTEKRRAWLSLLLRSSLESVGRIDDSHKSGFIGFCAQNGGWIERFAAHDADVAHLGALLEKFLEDESRNHQGLHLLRHSLPVFALSRWLDKYIQILSLQSKRHKFSDMRFDGGFALGLDVPDAPQLGKVLGVGVHFLLRELVRVGFVKDERAHPLCFHPTRSLKRFLEPFDAKFASDKLSHLDASKLAHKILQKELGDEAHFDLSFDIPLVRWAQGKNQT